MSTVVKPASPHNPAESQSRQVVYLFGAGASHACARFGKSSTGILMRDLAGEITERLRKLTVDKYSDQKSIQRLVNEFDDETEIEQVITFLEESGSLVHRQFAIELREEFRSALEKRLSTITAELQLGRSELYAAVIDMHRVDEFDEELKGIMTLNYDDLIEHAIQDSLGLGIDYGISIAPPAEVQDIVKLLKLHGSFNWQDCWPIGKRTLGDSMPLWIPPGIQKAKATYPFSVLWGMARELLDCDVLRIVGCRLTPNDWDLVSMLFTTRHVHSERSPYEVEIIDKVQTAEKIKSNFPYLGAKSLLELDGIGERMISELIGGDPRSYRDLSGAERDRVKIEAESQVANPFQYWLRLKAEIMYEDLDTIATSKGIIERFVSSH